VAGGAIRFCAEGCYRRIADQNQNLLGAIMRNNERLRDSRNASELPSTTNPLITLSSKSDAEGLSSTKEGVVTTTVKMVPADSLHTAQGLYADGVQDIAALDMANSRTPGGGYLSGSGDQEVADGVHCSYRSRGALHGDGILFLSTVLFTLQMCWQFGNQTTGGVHYSRRSKDGGLVLSVWLVYLDLHRRRTELISCTEKTQ